MSYWWLIDLREKYRDGLWGLTLISDIIRDIARTSNLYNKAGIRQICVVLFCGVILSPASQEFRGSARKTEVCTSFASLEEYPRFPRKIINKIWSFEPDSSSSILWTLKRVIRGQLDCGWIRGLLVNLVWILESGEALDPWQYFIAICGELWIWDDCRTSRESTTRSPGLLNRLVAITPVLQSIGGHDRNFCLVTNQIIYNL